MAGLTDEKIRAMEEEMNKFEAEIAGKQAASSAPKLAPPPPPPTAEITSSANRLPPPPPPIFMPHQLRARLPPPPPPPNPPRASPMSMLPPPPPPFPPMSLPMSLMNFGPPMGAPPTILSAPPMTFEPSRMIYSAPPQIRNATTKVENAVETQLTVAEVESQIAASLASDEMEIEIEQPASTSQQTTATQAAVQRNQGPKKKRFVRTAAGAVWEDPTLADWDPRDFRMFCGDLGSEVSDEVLARAFNRYTSFQKAKVVRDKRSGKTRGFGFVSFSDPNDFTRAMREMNGKYVGNRPIKLKKSDWRNRQIEVVKKRQKEKKKMGLKG